MNAVTTALTAVLGGQTDLQAAANTLAPYVAQMIGQQWGHGEDKNTAAQLAAHAILGVAIASVNGGDLTAGGSAAVASEAAATYFTNQYKDNKNYQDANGVFQPNLLLEDVKTQIRDLTAGIGAVIGGVAGDSTYNAQLAGMIGQNAVENNVYGVLDKNKNVIKDLNKLTAQALQACTQVQCVNMVLTNNAKEAMVNAPQIILLNGNNYKEGQIVSSPNNGSGLQYLVVKENGVLKAKLLPFNYQVINSLDSQTKCNRD